MRIRRGIVAYSAAVADLPVMLPGPYADALLGALDVEGKIPRALEALGPLAGRDVAVVGGGPRELAGLEAVAGQVMRIAAPAGPGSLALGVPPKSVDAVVARWSAFDGADPRDLDEADRALRPDGRLLVVHDYGRDDVYGCAATSRPTGSGAGATGRSSRRGSGSASSTASGRSPRSKR